MKTISIFLLCAAILPKVLPAQPTVTMNEFYHVGDLFNMINVDPGAVNVDTPGAGLTWDFSALGTSGGVSALTAEFNTSSIFGTSNLIVNLPDGDIEYMSENSSDSYVNGIISHTTHDTTTYTAYDIAKRPFSYGGYYLDTYKIDAVTPFTIGNGSLVITGDAWGTLKLPAGVYNYVLRIHKLQMETDTISGIDEPTVTTSKYLWFDTVHSAPLFEVDSVITGSGFATATAMYLAGPLGVQYVNAASPFSYTGYIQYNYLQLTGTFENGYIYDVVVYSVIGSKIYTGSFTATGPTQRIDIGWDLNPGIYIVSLTRQNDPSYSQVIKVLKQ